MNLATGFYGIPGKCGGIVHVHDYDTGRPDCGVDLNPKAEFQFCAVGVRLEYVECERCRKRHEKRARK
jgi:hypothetical protein